MQKTSATQSRNHMDRFAPLRSQLNVNFAHQKLNLPADGPRSFQKDSVYQGRRRLREDLNGVQENRSLSTPPFAGKKRNLQYSWDQPAKRLSTGITSQGQGSCEKEHELSSQTHQKSRGRLPRSPEILIKLPDVRKHDSVNTMAWSSKNVVCGAFGSTVALFDLGSKRSMRFCKLEDPHLYSSVGWDSAGTHVALGTSNGFIQIWDAEAQKKLCQVPSCHCLVACCCSALAWSPDDCILISGCEEGLLVPHDIRQEQRKTGTTRSSSLQPMEAHSGSVTRIVFSPSGDRVASSGTEGTALAFQWQWGGFSPRGQVFVMDNKWRGPIRAIDWHPWKSGCLVLGNGDPNGDGTLALWNVTKKELKAVQDTGMKVTAAVFCQRTGELVTSHSKGEDSEVIVWRSLEPHQTRMSVSESGNDVDTDVALDDGAEIVGTLDHQRKHVLDLLWGPDHTQLGAATSDETFYLWQFLPSSRPNPTPVKSHLGMCIR